MFNLFIYSGISSGSRYFYIYETGIWSNISVASLFKRDPNERLENSLNNGAGPIVNITRGAYHTDQYQLFSMIYYRALKDHRRTLDPSKASTFIIPYDFATDSAYYKNCWKTSGVCYDFRKCPLAPKVEELLNDSPWFTRHQGKDHLLIVGMNYAMDHYILKPKCKSLLAVTCRNCTKFAIDDYSFMYSGDAGINARGDFWHAAPFPGDFHWSREVKRPFPWENEDRPVLCSYVGSQRSYYGPARRLRGSIVHYCELHPLYCQHTSYGLNGTRFSFKVEGHNPLELSLRSTFCFQPIGDLMTRKGLFDSILLGCIPVVFDPLTASVMYTWHWEEDFWRQVAIEFDFHPVAHRYLDPVEHLKKMFANNRSDVLRRQRLIRERVFQLQYSREGPSDVLFFNSSLPYLTLLHNYSSSSSSSASVIYSYRTKASSESWRHIVNGKALTSWPVDKEGRPLKDAYDLVIDQVLGWHSGDIRRYRNATVPECWDGWLDKKNNRCQPGDLVHKKSGSKRR